MITNQAHLDMLQSPVRSIQGRVELLDGSTLVNTFRYTDALQSFTVGREGEGKFFGFGVCQKLELHLVDRDRAITITKDNTLDVSFGVEGDYIYPYPNFYITEINRNEKTNEISITAYDRLSDATNHRVSQLILPPAYSIQDFAEACATLLGVACNIDAAALSSFQTYYEDGANFEGSENIREALNAVAEATQTVYFMNSDWELTFKRLNANATATDISKADYFELTSGDVYSIKSLVHATELGDNLSATVLGATGETCYVRNNPFWELRDDLSNLLMTAYDKVSNLKIQQFDCNYRGNYLLEIGDKITLTNKDDSTFQTYVLNDSITYRGGLSGNLKWEYGQNESETAANPTTIGESIKQTYAKVDKVNKQIELVVSEVDANKSAISSLQMNTDSINASVTKIENDINDKFDNLNENFESLKEQVDLTITPEDVQIQITEALEGGINSVTTTTGFTFNEEGLTISKTDSEMTTQITEDGMTVYRDEEAVLVADNEGVKAANLHATTFLIVGDNSRFEDYTNTDGEARTGCFWIGGN